MERLDFQLANWINITTDGHSERVEIIELDRDRAIVFNEATHVKKPVTYDKIQGIPLEIEHIKRLGFKLYTNTLENQKPFKDYEKKFVVIRHEDYHNDFFFYFGCTHTKKIQYLHELQNLYRLSTGDSLTGSMFF